MKTCYFYLILKNKISNFSDSGHEMIIDVDSKPKEDILDHLIKVVGKSKFVQNLINIYSVLNFYF